MYNISYIESNQESSYSRLAETPREVVEFISGLLNSNIKKQDISLHQTIERDIDIDRFLQDHDLSIPRSVEYIEPGLMYYNFKTNQFDEAVDKLSWEDHVIDNYHKPEQHKLFTDKLEENPQGIIATIIEGDDNRFYLSSGYHFVNRLGYMIIKIKDEETQVCLNKADFYI